MYPEKRRLWQPCVSEKASWRMCSCFCFLGWRKLSEVCCRAKGLQSRKGKNLQRSRPSRYTMFLGASVFGLVVFLGAFMLRNLKHVCLSQWFLKFLPERGPRCACRVGKASRRPIVREVQRRVHKARDGLRCWLEEPLPEMNDWGMPEENEGWATPGWSEASLATGMRVTA